MQTEQLQSRGALQDWISDRAANSARYHEKLVQDPRGILEEHLGKKLPSWLNIEVVEEKADTVYLIAPHVASKEMSDQDLEMVAGGKGGGTTMGDVDCERNYGAFNSVITIESEVSLI